MIEVDEALKLVLDHARPLAPRRVPLADALGLVLAEDVESDVDSPPYDKAMVDGFAVLAADFDGGAAVQLEVVEEVMAGDVPQHAIERGQATRIMTGAPTPQGADAVVMVETTESLAAEGSPFGQVRIAPQKVTSGMNILRRATVMTRGDRVLSAGAPVRPLEIGLLAEVGRAELLTVARPRVAVLSTGNELVSAAEKPTAGKIRNSNGPMLTASVTRRGAEAIPLGIARDEREHLHELLARGLGSAEILVLSGGVSAGDLDLVPEVLTELGVEQVFHKVRLKPGKPLWFGVREDEVSSRLVFGLPGNPVSSLVCFELFVAPAIDRLAGRDARGTQAPIRAALSAPFVHKGERPTYHPGVLRQDDDAPTVEPLRWKGSADLRTLCSADALIHFPAGSKSYEVGEEVVASRLV